MLVPLLMVTVVLLCAAPISGSAKWEEFSKRSCWCAAGEGVHHKAGAAIPMGRLVRAEFVNGNYGQFQGNWSGRSGVTSIQLSITGAGGFRWVATVGNARGLGEGRIWEEAGRYFVDLQFLQQSPLELRAHDRNSFTLLSQEGTIMTLHRKSEGTQERR